MDGFIFAGRRFCIALGSGEEATIYQWLPLEPTSATAPIASMLFRTQICVVLAVRQPFWRNMPGDRLWEETATCLFGINADDAAAATQIAVRAAEAAVDRDGEFVGGIVAEVQSKCVGPEEFDMHERYLLQPKHLPGIFYVSGITFSSLVNRELHGLSYQLQLFRDSIARSGLPATSFTHPPLPPPEPAPLVRIVCPVCECWVEVAHDGLLYSFFDGLERFSPEEEEGRRAVSIAGPFVRNHFSCLRNQDDVNALVFLYPDDERYACLDAAKRME